ncbi:septum formation initiator [Nonomuraea soli]|uniref:Septum formation initiator n=1 Tax=Nonomuraea soli TaxID=1032476 RepID=A0A7W0CDH5_9ACTN|nr:septum formation initiator [Nonomuraea soli]MBA2889019.1 hypothetical protein [Nonomuraea soli]
MTRLVLAWVATALAAIAAGVAVLGLLGGSSLAGGGGKVLDRDEVRDALAAATTSPTPSAAPSSSAASSSAAPSSGAPSAVPSGSPSSQASVLTTAGGTIVASCSAGQVTLRSWSPAQGYSIDDADPGPAPTVKVEFEPEDGDELEVRVGCAGERPVVLP